jgi:hypothetical protein
MRVSSSGVVFDQSALASQLTLQFFLGRQRKTIARGEKLLALVQDRIARDGVVLLRAENQTDGGVIAVRPPTQRRRHLIPGGPSPETPGVNPKERESSSRG